MNIKLLTILGLAAIGSVAGLIGGVIFLIKDSWARKISKYAVPFAAGVLLSVSLLNLIPEAEHLIGKKAFLVVLLSLLASFFFERFFASLHHHEHSKIAEKKASIPLIIFGDTIHNFIDGVAIAAAYLTNPTFGLIVAFASFLHETPHEIGDFGILISAGWKKGKTFWVNFLSAMATFPGALFVYYSAQGENFENVVGTLLAVAAGVFLFLGASDFLPEVGEEERGVKVWKKSLFLILGVGIIYTLSLVFPDL